VVRNVCAHHGRLRNRTLTRVGTSLPVRRFACFAALPDRWDQVERVYRTISVITHLLDTVSPQHTWRIDRDNLVSTSFAKFTLRAHQPHGLPNNHLTAERFRAADYWVSCRLSNSMAESASRTGEFAEFSSK
jgi:abortive infection bacteriophage resistance protein